MLEFLIALAIIIIAASISLPMLGTSLQHSQQELLPAQLLHTIQFARSEAILHHQPISICHSDDHISCHGEWQQGQIIFLDPQNEGSPATPNQIISVQQFSSATGRLFWQSFPNEIEYLQFTADGMTQIEDGSFYYCLPKNKNPSWAILISKSGRAREILPNKNGEVLDEKGQRLGCPVLLNESPFGSMRQL